MKTIDALIIGGGIIGCTLARELACVYRGVVVVERRSIGCGASSAAAGLLTPGLVGTPAGSLMDLAYKSAADYETWLLELQRQGAGDVGFRRAGFIQGWENHETADTFLRGLDDSIRTGRRCIRLSSSEFRQREPTIERDIAGALYFPDDAQINPALLVAAVAEAARRVGATIRENEEIRELRVSGQRIVEVVTSRETFQPGIVVVTGGSWSEAVLAPLGLRLPMKPIKGQMLLAEVTPSPIRTPLYIDDALFHPRPDGTMVLGVTVENVGFDDGVTLAGIQTILESTTRLAPWILRHPFVRAWSGLRPSTPDDWPYMGPMPPLENLWISTGHYRKGILLAPLCARLMAHSILADHLCDELIPFKPTRGTR